MLNSVAFLDRDGVINIDKGYVYKIKDFEWITDAKKAIKYLKDLNYVVIVVTNKSGLSRGFYSEEDIHKLHDFINKELSKIGTLIDEFFYSPYHPDFKNKKYNELVHLRKPNTGMLELADKKWGINKKESFLIGDKESDIECALRYGINGHLFKNGSLLNFVKQIV